MVQKIKRKKPKDEIEQAPEQTPEEIAAAEEAELAAQAQDEFQAKGIEYANWMQENQGLVLGGIAAVLAVGVGLGFWTSASSSGSEEATTAYLAATKEDTGGMQFAFAAPDVGAHEEALNAAANKFGDTSTGKVIHLHAGHAALAAGKGAEALGHFDAYLAKAGEGDALKNAGQVGRGFALLATGKADDALAAFESVIAGSDKLEADTALWQAARLHHQKGNNDKARSYADRIVADFADSPLQLDAKDLLKKLGAPADKA